MDWLKELIPRIGPIKKLLEIVLIFLYPNMVKNTIFSLYIGHHNHS
jgi:hypothetical protein